MVDSASACVTALWWILLYVQRGERRASAQTRSMGQVKMAELVRHVLSKSDFEL